MNKHKTILSICWLFLIQSLIAQSSHPTSEGAVRFATRHVIQSSVFGQPRTINISLPESFSEASSDHTYPVFILLEGEFFQMVSGVIKHLSSVERMPETIVVSVEDEPSAPAVYTNESNFWPGPTLAGENHELFTNHLKQELLPYLEREFRANDFRIVMGLSYTSIYTLHTFIKEPDLFDAHIAIAAGDILGMGYQEGERFMDLMQDEIMNTPEKNRYLYVTSADADGGGKAPEIAGNLKELNEELRSLQAGGLKYYSGIYDNEGHYDVALPGLIDALELIFPKHRWFARYRDIIAQPGPAMQNLDDYYENLSKVYGFEILPRAVRWNSVNRLSWIGPRLVRQGQIDEGIEVIRRWARYRPSSHLAYSELSSAYEKSGNMEKARNALQRAYEISKDGDSSQAREYLERLENLKD